MKARFFALAALVLGLASCQQDFDMQPTQGGEVDFQLKVDAVELATRAGAEGADDTQADLDSGYGAIDYLQGSTDNDGLRLDWTDVDLRYTLEVYDKADSYATPVLVKDRMVKIVDKYEPVVFDLRLVPNREYHFVVFADFVNTVDATEDPAIEAQRNIGRHHVIGETLADITIKEDGINNEATDAYFATKDITISNSAVQDIVLRRPYGKLRVIATDLHELNLNVNPAAVVVEYTAAHPAAFNAITGEVSATYEAVSYTSAYNTIYKEVDKGGLNDHFYTKNYDNIDGHQYTNADGKVRHTHMTLFTDYILAERVGQTPYHFTMKVYDSYDKNTKTVSGLIKETVFSTDIPIERNHLTTIIGNVLTTATEVKVTIDDNFINPGEIHIENKWDGTSKEPKYNPETKTYFIEEASELAWLADQVNGVTRAGGKTFEGETFQLSKDLDLNGDRWTPIGATGKFKGTFDGKNHIVSNLVVSNTDTTPAGLFANAYCVKNLKVVNAKIYGHYKAGVIVGDGLCARVENCHVDGAIVEITPLDNDDANHAGGIVGYLSAEPTAYVKNCSVKNATISAYRDVAAIVGTANVKAEVSGNTAENVVVVANQAASYNEYKAANAGEVVGRIHANAVIKNNTANNVNVAIQVNTVDKLSYIANNTPGDVYIVFDETIYGNAIIKQREGVNVVIDGQGKSFVGTFDIYGGARFDKPETLKFTNIQFVYDETHDFITCNTTESEKRYAHNVTIENCEFRGNDTADIVGMRFRQCYNITVKDCKATNVHSLMWATGGDNFVVDGVEISGKNGISFGTTTNLVVKNSTIKTEEYGIRTDASVETSLAIENTTIEANVPVIARKVSKNYTVALDNATLVKGGTYHVVFTTGSDDVAYVAPESYTITGASNYAVFPITTTGNYTDEEGNTVVSTGAGLQEALNEGDDIVLEEDITVAKADAGSNAYGATGVNQKNGGTIDGGGNDFGVNAWGTWDSAISTTGGTIKNITINKGMRGIFVNHNSDYSSKVYLENVIIDGTVYTISCDQGTNQGLEATDCVFNGWTSYAVTIGDVKFTNCSFGEGQGYAFCRPYAPTTFVGCEFEAGYKMDPRAEVRFIDCTFNGEALTPANVGNLVTSNVANAKFTDEEGNPVVGTQEDLTEAIKNNDTVVLVAGNYNMPSPGGKDITIKGDKDVVINAGASNMGSCNVTLEGVTITAGSYKGFQHSGVVTYNDVTIQGQINCYGEKDIFNYCTFELDNSYVWTYGSKNTEFNNCTFNTNGKAILIYNEGAGACNVKVEGCTFNATAGAKAGAIANQNCAAIEIDNYASMKHVLTTSNNTVDSDFSGEWRIKSCIESAPVTVNGVEYTQIAVDGKLMTIDADKNVTVLE